jgi:DNA invertase Pin-like site-specific DNA recombinase
MPTPLPRVYSYMRFSDPRQAAGTSATRQLAYAANWARDNGIPLDTTLTLRDEGLSAYHQAHVKRGALGTFLRAVEEGKVAPGSVLIVEGLDRLSRAEPIEAQAQLTRIVSAGISVVTAADNRTYSRETMRAQPMELIMSLLVMIRAHEESETKSKRVSSAIRHQCKAWQAGTYRGLIVNGKDPAWCRHDGTAWQLVPERVAAVQHALDLFAKGYGASRIVKQLEEKQLHLTERGPQALQIYRLVRQRGLMGTKDLTLGGETYLLDGYYPALLTADQWQDLQVLADTRGRRRVKGGLPHVVTGIGVLVCGYCGVAMVGQTAAGKPRLPDGRVRDCHRRLNCTATSHGTGCKVTGSISEAPIERAVMSYCSDMLNLQALYGPDRSSGPKAELATAKQRLIDTDAALSKLTDLLLVTDKPPQTFVAKARELETQRAEIASAIARLERDVAQASQRDIGSEDTRWRDLVAGVEAQDYEARLQARQLVADTFERIAVYRKGRKPSRTPAGEMDLVLLAKGGISRQLRINKNGDVLSADDVDTTRSKHQ